jgi:hypothetical protein
MAEALFSLQLVAAIKIECTEKVGGRRIISTNR